MSKRGVMLWFVMRGGDGVPRLYRRRHAYATGWSDSSPTPSGAVRKWRARMRQKAAEWTKFATMKIEKADQ